MILPREGENADTPRDHSAPESAELPEGIGNSGYAIRLDRFEGPLDLLLYLIQRDEIDVYDIPIAEITESYLEFIEDLDQLDLEKAGEFLVMASTLMRIKARLLLPVQRSDEEDEGEDPRDELVRRLLEYKKFKEASQSLADAEEKRRQIFGRTLEYPFRDQIPEEPPEFSLSLVDLLGSVRNVLEQIKGDHLHHVYQEIFTVEEQSRKLTELVGELDGVLFEDLFTEARSKMEVVVTFVAMLELMKQGRIVARQVGNYEEIRIYRGKNHDPGENPGEEENHHAA